MKKVICIILVFAILLSICVFASASSSQYGCFQLTNFNTSSNDSSFNMSAIQVLIGNVTGQYKFGLDYYKNPHNGEYAYPRVRMRFDAKSYIGNGDFNTAMYNDSIDFVTYKAVANILNSSRWSNTGTYTADTSVLKFQLSVVSSIPLFVVSFHFYMGSSKVADRNYGINEIAQKNGMLYTISKEIPQDVGNFDRIYVDLTAYPKYSASGTKYWDTDYWDISIGSVLVPFWQPRSSPNISQVTSTYSSDMAGLVSATNRIQDYLEDVLVNQEMSIGEYQYIETLLNMIIGNLEVIHTNMDIVYPELMDFLQYQVVDMAGDLEDLLDSSYMLEGYLLSISADMINLASDASTIRVNMGTLITNTNLIYSDVHSMAGYMSQTYTLVDSINTKLINTNIKLDDVVQNTGLINANVVQSNVFLNQIVGGLTTLNSTAGTMNQRINQTNSYLSVQGNTLFDILDVLEEIQGNTADILDWAEDFEIEINGATSDGKTFMQTIWGFVKNIFGAFVGFVGGIFSYSVIDVLDDFDGSEVFGNE